MVCAYPARPLAGPEHLNDNDRGRRAKPRYPTHMQIDPKILLVPPARHALSSLLAPTPASGGRATRLCVGFLIHLYTDQRAALRSSSFVNPLIPVRVGFQVSSPCCRVGPQFDVLCFLLHLPYYYCWSRFPFSAGALPWLSELMKCTQKDEDTLQLLAVWPCCCFLPSRPHPLPPSHWEERHNAQSPN